MSTNYTEEQNFKGLDQTKQPLPKGEYTNCTFVQCDFSNTHLSNYTFLECNFTDCDLSNTHPGNTAFRQVTFKDCKLLGTRFDECNRFLLEMHFENCRLQLSSFYKLPLKACRFESCRLNEVDFTEADLSTATIRNCDLTQAIFESTNLAKTDLRLSHGFSIDPEINTIDQAIFSKESLSGLLSKYRLKIE